MDTLTGKGLRLVPQLGVSKYRLDFAVLHPDIPNKYILAIECDGAPYHSAATARDRDRLRQTHLENRGWRFHRIWSLDWHEHRSSEIERVFESYKVALTLSDQPVGSKTPPLIEVAEEEVRAPRGRGAKPRVRYLANIGDYYESEIRDMIEWICSDGVMRSDDEILIEIVPELGFKRRGRLIDERIRLLIARWRRSK